MTLKTKQELAASVYFVVGRGTEGGTASYKISVAGVSESQWQSPALSNVQLNSGYTIGAMQLDLGARGTLAVGSTSSLPKTGEQSYVDAVISQSQAYAIKNNLAFPSDTSDLRSALLTHGNGGTTPSGATRTSITFIDANSRDTINAWAGSDEGRNWIHKNVDMPIVSDAASKAFDVVQKYGSSWSNDDKNLAALELAKVYNQTGNLNAAKSSLAAFTEPTFGNLTDALSGNLDAEKALKIGQTFFEAGRSDMRTWLDSAQKKILAPDFDPAQFNSDSDLKLAIQLTKRLPADVVVVDGQLSIKAGSQTYRYTMSDDKSTVNLDIVTGAGTKKETVVGGEFFNNQAVLNGHGLSQTTAASTTPAPTGHWEDTTQYDALGNVSVTGERVWVSDAPSTSASSTTGGASSNSSNSPATPSAAHPDPSHPNTTQISSDGTSATLPNGQVIHAGTGASLYIDREGNLVADRPAAGWTNADGSDSDIRQITTYDAKGASLGTVIAQSLPGQSALIENGEERTFTTTQGDGTSVTVQAHFSAGTGWVNDQTGETVLNLKDWETQTEEHNAHLRPGPSADNDYQPDASNGEAEAMANMPNMASTPNTPNQLGAPPEANPPSALQPVSEPVAEPAATHAPNLSAPDRNVPEFNAPAFDTTVSLPALPPLPDLSNTPSIQLADAGTGTMSDAGPSYSFNLPTTPSTTASDINVPNFNTPDITIPDASDSHFGRTSGPSMSGTAGDAAFNRQLAITNAGLSLVQGIASLQNWDRMDDLGHLNALVGLANNINTLTEGGLGNLDGLGQVLGGINLIQALNDHNIAGVISGVNALSNQAIDGMVNKALGTTGVPYVGVALALNDFDKHPGQSIASLVGMYFGGPLGGAIGGMIGGLLDQAGLFGHHDAPPPPVGIVSFTWNSEGHIQTHLDFDQSGGGKYALSTADKVQVMFEGMITSINTANPAISGTPYALNPFMLPRVGVDPSGVWLEITLPDGTTAHQGLNDPNLGKLLGESLYNSGAIAPEWIVQTQLEHMHHLHDQGVSDAAIHAELSAGAGGYAHQGNQAYALQGNAMESADFKTQHFGALVAHLGADPAVQAITQALQTLQDQQAQDRVATSTLYRDTKDDGYLEKTQWVSATDAQGHVQGLLVLDYNGNGQIETRDILNIGGNAGQAGNASDEAALATQNAALQRNNVQWLDANGNGVLDKGAPAFAAIKLWVDVNQDAQMQGHEGYRGHGIACAMRLSSASNLMRSQNLTMALRERGNSTSTPAARWSVVIRACVLTGKAANDDFARRTA
jgi:hypothetical protein